MSMIEPIKYEKATEKELNKADIKLTAFYVAIISLIIIISFFV